MITKILTKSIVSSFVSRIITATAHNAQVILEWMLNLDGTNYMELSEPKTFAGDFEWTINTKNVVVLNKFLAAGDSNNTWLTVSALGEIKAKIDGNSIKTSTGLVADDGFNHAFKVIRTGQIVEIYYDDNLEATSDSVLNLGDAIIEILATHTLIGQNFQGIIHSVNLTDLDTPSNSISWNIDSGPETGTIYQDSEEYGTDSDIMRADDWGTPPAGVTVDGRTATFDGTQSANAYVYVNDGELHTGLHIITFRVYGETQGFIKVDMVSSPYSGVNKSSGIYTVYQNPANAVCRVLADADFDGSVEIISIKPVSQGLIMQNVSTDDWAKQ